MRRRPRADWDDDNPFLPPLTIFEPERGLKRAIGFVRFHKPVKVVNRVKAVKKRRAGRK